MPSAIDERSAIDEHSPIDDYIAELGRALRGPRDAKADLLVEACDSLHDAAMAYEDAGLSRGNAERRAVADFGSVREIAPEYQGELAVMQSRRTALFMLLAIGVQPLLWQEWWPWFSAYPDRAGGLAYAVVNESVEWLGAVTIAAALLAVFALGVGSRYVAAGGHRMTRLVGRSAMALCGTFAVLGLALCLLSPNEPLPVGLLWLTAFLLLPLAAVAGAARRCLALV